jgi:Toastrack DUF4097
MQQSFEVSGPAELDVRLASGEIEVELIEGATRVELELIAHDDESQQLVDATRVELHEHQDRPQVIVDVPQRRGGFNFGLLFGRQGITCRLRAPERSGLSVRAKSADVSARGTLGGANVSTASGDVRLEDVDGGLNVKSASGDVSAREVTSGANVQTASGDVNLDVVRGPVNAATASGDLRIGEAWDNVNANTVSGDQEHGAVMRGKVNAQSVSGDVTVAVRRGSKVFLDCNTVSGDTSSELELMGDEPLGDGPLVEIRAKTVSGDIRITRAPAPDVQPPTDNDQSAQEVHA